LNEPDEGYLRSVSCTLYLINSFLLLSLGRYHCWNSSSH